MTNELFALFAYTTLPLLAVTVAGLLALRFVVASRNYQLLVMVALVALMGTHQLTELATYLTTGAVQTDHVMEATETVANLLAAGTVYVGTVVVEHRRIQGENLAALLRFLRHDLRNDLNVVLGHLETVETRRTDATAGDEARIARETLERFTRKADRSRLLERFLRRPPATRPVAFGRLLRTELRAIRDDDEATRIDATIPETVDVLAGEYLQDALGVLLEHTVEHGAGDGVVDLHVAEHSGAVVLALRAPDSTLAPDEWDATFHGDEADSLDHGVGLGLFFVRTIVRYYDGTITHRTADDGTHHVTLTLPRPTHGQRLKHLLLPKRHHWVWRISA